MEKNKNILIVEKDQDARKKRKSLINTLRLGGK